MQISASLTHPPTGIQVAQRSKWYDLLIMTLLFGVALVLFALNWRYSFTNGAYGTIGGESTLGALRVLQGELPYRDFWTLYAPGHFYLLALIFRLFGTTLMVEVVAASLFCALASCALYWLLYQVTQRRLLGFAAAVVFVAALINSDYYYYRFETYPPTILSLFVSLILVVAFYQKAQLRYLVLAGLMTGLIAVFKHDVGAYTAIAVSAGLLMYHSLNQTKPLAAWRSLLLQLLIYGASVLVVVLPVVIFFAIVAGQDAWQDIVVFPLTDWRFSRPESYPSLLPVDLYTPSLSDLIDNLFNYVKFTTPFVLNVLGVVTIGLAIRQRQAFIAAIGTTFWVAFWFHFSGAHLQINTHIITMAAYAAGSGALLYHLLSSAGSTQRQRLLALCALLVFCGWSFTLTARPLYNLLRKQRNPTVPLTLPRVAGFQVMPFEADTLNGLAAFVDQHVRPDQYLYIGLNRHDTMVTNDILAYFVLDRPIPVRYNDLHPAVADRAPAQHEMIADLEAKQPPYVILKSIFSDAELDQMKADFQKNLPGVGATDLDQYLHEHYVPVADFLPYRVYARKTQASQ